MANPVFIYYPDPLGTAEKIDLGEHLSDIQELDGADVEDAYGGDGSPDRAFLGAALRFRVVLERYGTGETSELERKLTSLQRHLWRGGRVAFAKDEARIWGCVPNTLPSRGDVVLYTSGNGFTAWNPAGDLFGGDEICIENIHPEAHREIAVIAAPTVHPPLNLSVAAGVTYTYAFAPMVRHRHFYPVCWAPKDTIKPITPSDHWRNWTLDITLEYLPAEAIALFDDPENPAFALGPIAPQFNPSPPALMGFTPGTGASIEAALFSPGFANRGRF